MQLLVNAILTGGLYSALAAGFSILYGVMNVMNVAHGAFIMVGAYISYTMFTTFNIDPFISLPISGLGLFILGFIFYRYVFKRIMGAGIFMGMVITYGFSLLLENIIMLIYSSNYRGITTAYSGKSFSMFDVIIPYTRLAIFLSALLLTVLIFLFMKYSRMGKSITAVSLNKYAASLVGIDINFIFNITFAIGTGLAGIAGGLLASVNIIYPQMGVSVLFKSFVVAVLGGLGNMSGVLIGGILLALFEVLGAQILGPNYFQLIGFLLMVLVLCIRPQGVLGRKFFASVTSKEIGTEG